MRQSEEEIFARITQLMDEKWPKIHALKDRTEEKITHRWPYRVLTTEIPFALLLGHWQEEFGNGSVIIQTVKANPALNDDKTREQLEISLRWDQTYQANATKTPLPPKHPVHPGVEVNDWLRWAELYAEYGLIDVADSALGSARTAVDRWEVYLESRDRADEFRKDTDRMYTKISDTQEKLEPAHRSGREGDLHSLQRDFLAMFRHQSSASFILDEMSDEEKLGRLEELADLIARVNASRDSIQDDDSLDYIQRETIALFDEVAESYLSEHGEIKGFRVSPHKTIFITDKDASIEAPATPLKQSPVVTYEGRFLEPHHAVDMVSYAVSGFDIRRVLTGSAANEAWYHILAEIEKVIDAMGLPKVAQVVALERIKMAGNESTSIIAIDTEEFERTGRIKPAQLVHNKKYQDGKWVDISTMRVDDGTGNDNKVNRAAVWSTSLKVYLRELVSSKRLRNQLESLYGDYDHEELIDFINGLQLQSEDLPDLAEKEFNSMRESLAWGFERMLKRAPDGIWKDRFDDLFDNHRESTEYKISQTVDNLDTPKERLTPQEEIMAGLLAVHFKDSHWSFVSIDGALIGYLNNHDDRFAAIGNLLGSEGFWKNVRDQWKDEMDMLGLKDKDGGLLIYAPRGGPGYLNVAFGGLSKVNFIMGTMYDPRTKGKIVIPIGDSITDQGQVPHVSTVSMSPSLSRAVMSMLPARVENRRVTAYKDASTGMYNGLMVQMNELAGMTELEFYGHMADDTYSMLTSLSNDSEWQRAVDELREKGHAFYKEDLPSELLRKLTVRWDEKTGAADLKFKGPMSDEEYEILKKLRDDAEWQTAIYKLYEYSSAVYRKRLVLRFLLSGLLELDNEEREEAMKTGVIRTQYLFTKLDPFGDTFNIEWWGPAAYFPIISALQRVTEKGLIYGHDDMIEVRDAFLRDVIEELHNDYTRHMLVYPTSTMTRTTPELQPPAETLASAQPVEVRPIVAQEDLQGQPSLRQLALAAQARLWHAVTIAEVSGTSDDVYIRIIKGGNEFPARWNHFKREGTILDAKALADRSEANLEGRSEEILKATYDALSMLYASYFNKRDISDPQNEVVYFHGDDVVDNQVGFAEAVSMLGENQQAVVLARDDTQAAEIRAIADIYTGLNISNKYRVFTLEELGLAGWDFNTVMNEDGYGIIGIPHMRFIPLSDLMEKHPEEANQLV